MIAAESDLTGAAWFRSSHSTETKGSCVEVAGAAGWVGVRDTRQRGLGTVLAFTGVEWCAFLAGVRRGEHYRP